MKVLLLVLSLSGILGCGPSNKFHGDAAFSAEERAEVEAAAGAMAERTGGERIEVDWGADVGDDEQRIVRRQPPDPGAWGQFTMSSRSYARTVWLRPGMSLPALRRVAEHELGHYYGLDHLPAGEEGLMRAEASGEWGENDVRECRRVGRC